MEKKYETYKVFTKKIAIELRKLGYQILRTEPNFNKPEFDVYIFIKTENFMKDMQNIVDSLKNN